MLTNFIATLGISHKAGMERVFGKATPKSGKLEQRLEEDENE